MSGQKHAAFKPYHMEQLRRLGMGGHPCATFAAREIEQLNEYVYALELVLVRGFSNGDEVRELIVAMRDEFAPDVDLPEVPGAMAGEGALRAT